MQSIFIWKQLCHLAESVGSHKMQIYYHYVRLFCILISSGSRSNEQRKQSKQNEKYTSSVFRICRLCFYLIYCIFISGDYTRTFAPRFAPEPWRGMSLSADGFGWHSAPGLLGHLGANIMACYPRSYVTYVYNVDLSENYVDLPDIKLTSRWHVGTLILYKNKLVSS